ncbi:Phosphoribosylanthranilate isomerase [Actinokineospora spheciospongiae]|uniref:N-(5'-phosphoribosyl)anthranilate isomerase n=1 Tax=Actinokineospora spheciospongiae TaxID=909613 RepID=W7IKF8_9PSEU|nr:hypothetical protein [Actinokineospora spheciospongiae]EWC61345.1 Phosphoribosylanthranilate isomerase [Actinokineospora spheciospongiae]
MTVRSLLNPLLKVCGATAEADIDLLAAGGVNLVGLWHGVPGGPAELPLDRLADLAAAARSTGRLRPVLVTFLADADAIADAMEHSGIEWVQLHAYQPPALVKALRQRRPGAHILKVLHVADGQCVEKRLIPAYERAGVDTFLLDRVGLNGQVGSTGLRLAESDVVDLVAGMTIPFVLAGGIDADSRPSYPRLSVHPGMLGVDVDTAARGGDGRFDRHAVAALTASWGGEPETEVLELTVPTARPVVVGQEGAVAP